MFFKRLFSFISNIFKTDGDIEDVAVFPKIDPDKIRKELRIAENAKRHGEKGLPLNSATQLTDVEHNILAHLGRDRERLVKWATSALKQNQNRLDSIDISIDFNRTIKLGEEYERDADQLLSKNEGELSELKKTTLAKTEELELFKKNNQLIRMPKITPSSMVFLYSTLIFLFVVGEGSINAGFFASGLSGGLIEGFIFAGSLSAANLIVCLVLGRFMTLKNHVKKAYKLAGFLILIIALGWTMVVGLLTAHIRDALMLISDDSQSPWLVAKTTLTATPFELDDIRSYTLCTITIFFGLLAIWKGYFWTDTYPGYAKVFIKYENAQRDYVLFLEKTRDDIEKHKLATLELIDINIEKMRRDIESLKRNMKTKQVTKKRLDEEMIYAEQYLISFIKLYRMENMLARPNSVEQPKYFDNPVEFEHVPYPEFGIEQDDKKLALQESYMDKIVNNIENIRATVQQSFNQKFDQLQPLQQIF